jgi:hypothetical protein
MSEGENDTVVEDTEIDHPSVEEEIDDPIARAAFELASALRETMVKFAEGIDGLQRAGFTPEVTKRAVRMLKTVNQMAVRELHHVYRDELGQAIEDSFSGTDEPSDASAA